MVKIRLSVSLKCVDISFEACPSVVLIHFELATRPIFYIDIESAAESHQFLLSEGKA